MQTKIQYQDSNQNRLHLLFHVFDIRFFCELLRRHFRWRSCSFYGIVEDRENHGFVNDVRQDTVRIFEA